jgi:hypothetical protein
MRLLRAKLSVRSVSGSLSSRLGECLSVFEGSGMDGGGAIRRNLTTLSLVCQKCGSGVWLCGAVT